jgi:hypothetical protein
MDLGPLLNAHAYLRVERPPELWAAAVDDVALVRVLGEMIAAALVRGAELGEVVLRVNNVTVEAPDPSEGDCGLDGGGPAPGDYVALSILGRGDWRPEVLWGPETAGPTLVNADLDQAARAAGIPFAYTRSEGDGGSVTVFLGRG